VTAYDEGRRAGRQRFAASINHYAPGSQAAIDWGRGWLREISLHKRTAPKPAPRHSALVVPHPAMTGEQIELLCRREGLALAHLGRERFVLVHTASRPQTMLRIARAETTT
jgi:hypothetical protein